jgi:conjugal transfer pilus assembly protein TraU
VGFDNVCQSGGSFDVGFMSEFDPSWEDDVAAMIVNPEAILFANPIAIAACLADCAKANVNFGIKELFWCAGCNGSLYPLNGNVQSQVAATQAASVLMQRLTLKMHRLGLLKRYHGFKALCGPVTDPIMDKRAYKSHMTYPIPYTSSVQPLGRTTVIWGSGREYPFKGEDFAFLMFRKRNCCSF